MKRTVSLRAKVLLALASAALSIGFVELLLRIGGYDLNPSPQWRFHGVYGWTSDPAGLSMAGGTVEDVLPSGFRHRVKEVAKPPGVKRLLVLGDSFSAATSLPYDSTCPGVLESLLSTSGDERWQVVNLSSDDWGTTQQLLALTHEGLDFEPDAVVLQVFPFNDFCNNSLALAHTCSHQDDHRPYFATEGDQLRLTSTRPLRTWLRRCLHLFGALETLATPLWRGWPGGADESRQAHLARQEFFRRQARRAGLQYPGVIYSLIPRRHQPPAIRQAWGVTALIFHRLLEVLRQRDIPLLVLVVPFSQTFPYRWDEFRRQTGAPVQADHATAWVEERFRSWDVPVISVRRRIMASGMHPEDFFISERDGHFNSYGHLRAAQWIAEEMREMGLAPAPPSALSELPADLLREESPRGLSLRGFDQVSRDAHARWRWAMGPEAEIVFEAERVRPLKLNFRLYNLIGSQQVTLLVNGRQLLAPLQLDTLGEQPRKAVAFQTTVGRNVIQFEFSDWNGRQSAYFPDDSRPLAVNFSELTIEVGPEEPVQPGR